MQTIAHLRSALLAHYDLAGRKSVDRARIAISNFCSDFSDDTLLSEIGYQDLQNWAAARLQERAPATVRYELAIVRKGWRELGKCSNERPPPFPLIRVENTRERFLEDKEIAEIRKRLRPSLSSLVGFLAWTGWRVGEATSLPLGNVAQHEGKIYLSASKSKNGKQRIFPYAKFAELDRLIGEQIKATEALGKRLGSPIPTLFWSDRGRSAGSPLKSFRKAWSTACREAGVPWAKVHDLRRSAVRRLVRAGVQRKVSMRLTGHLTEAVFERYNIVVDNDLNDAMGKLSDYVGQEEQQAIGQ